MEGSGSEKQIPLKFHLKTERREVGGLTEVGGVFIWLEVKFWEDPPTASFAPKLDERSSLRGKLQLPRSIAVRNFSQSESLFYDYLFDKFKCKLD